MEYFCGIQAVQKMTFSTNWYQAFCEQHKLAYRRNQGSKKNTKDPNKSTECYHYDKIYYS